jgi:DNA-binding transcriptional LysR family regulator
MTAFDDLQLLRAFVRIAESGSISAAARSLRLPQPTLSRHLRTLEDRAGTTLLLRDTHRTRLTDAGHRFVAEARAMLELAEQASDRLRDDRTVLRGHLRLFATVDFGQSGLTRMLSSFLLAHPEVTAELSYSNRAVQMIEAGFDAGVVAGDITDDQVVARRIGTITRCYVVSPSLLTRRPKPKDPRDLSTYPWLALSQRQFGGTHQSATFVDGSRSQSLHLTPVLIAEGVTSLREAALAGLGVVALPLWLIHEDLASGRFVRVLPEWSAPSLALSVIHVAQRVTPARLRAFIEHAAIHAQPELDGRSPSEAGRGRSKRRRPL